MKSRNENQARTAQSTEILASHTSPPAKQTHQWDVKRKTLYWGPSQPLQCPLLCLVVDFIYRGGHMQKQDCVQSTQSPGQRQRRPRPGDEEKAERGGRKRRSRPHRLLNVARQRLWDAKQAREQSRRPHHCDSTSLHCALSVNQTRRTPPDPTPRSTKQGGNSP